MQGNKCLQIIAINNCSSLVTISMNDLPSTLKSLEIYECKNLQLFHPRSLMLDSHYYFSLKKLHLRCCDSLVSFPLSLFYKLEDLHVQHCNNLNFISYAPNSTLPYFRKLKLKQCSKLSQFPEGGLHAPKLDSLSIINCVDFSSESAWY